MKAILRTHLNETKFVDKIVDIDDKHNFAGGPYQDTVPFAVGSNQEILQLNRGGIRRIIYSTLDIYRILERQLLDQ